MSRRFDGAALRIARKAPAHYLTAHRCGYADCDQLLDICSAPATYRGRMFALASAVLTWHSHTTHAPAPVIRQSCWMSGPPPPSVPDDEVVLLELQLARGSLAYSWQMLQVEELEQCLAVLQCPPGLQERASWTDWDVTRAARLIADWCSAEHAARSVARRAPDKAMAAFYGKLRGRGWGIGETS